MRFLNWLLIMMLCAGAVQAQSVVALIGKGNTFYNQQQYTLAEAQYKAALEKEPENVTAQYNLASSLYRQKKYGEAHGVLKKLGPNVPKELQAQAAYNNGVVYTKEAALEASIDAYKTALRLAPDDEQARQNLQRALLEQRKRQQQKKEQEQKQQKQSSLSQKEAEQRLKLLQEKEKQLQQRLQRGSQKGNAMPKDW